MRYWLPILLLLISSPASAGLFADDEARQRITALEAQVARLEAALARTEEDSRARIRALLDLQMQLEAQAAEVRKLRGENEEKQHALQDIEKRQKDLYLDLDARLKRLETAGAAVRPAPTMPTTDGRRDVPDNPLGENKAFEVAYGLYKAEDYQRAAIAFRDFLRQFPQTVHEANVHYWTGNAHFLSGAFADAIESYQLLIEKFPDHPRVPEAMLNVAESQVQLKNKTAAKKTLKQLISQFPGSDAADKAKKRLAALK